MQTVQMEYNRYSVCEVSWIKHITADNHVDRASDHITSRTADCSSPSQNRIVVQLAVNL